MTFATPFARVLTPLTLLAIAATTGACGVEEESAEDYAWVLPDERIRIAMPDAQTQRAAGDVSQFRQDTKDIVNDVNGFIDEVLTTIDKITSYDPTWAEDTENKAVWGPWEDGGMEGMLYVQKFDDDHYEWALLSRPAGTNDDAWVAFVGGQVDPGATETTGSGRFAVDFDAYQGVDPSSEPGGVFYSEYAVQDDAVAAEAGFDGFYEHPSDTPVDAGYRYMQDANGGAMDVAYLDDIEEGGDLETVVLRSRWTPTGEGRGDAYITGGDFGPLVYNGTECWNAGGVVTFEENNADFQRSGDESSCVFAEPEWNDDGV